MQSESKLNIILTKFYTLWIMAARGQGLNSRNYAMN